MKKLLPLLLVLSPAAMAFNTFTVDPNTVNGNGLAPFDATAIDGNSSGLIHLNGITGDISGSGWLQFSDFVNGPDQLDAATTGLGGVSYKLWLHYDSTSSLISGTFGKAGSTYSLDTLTFNMFADPLKNDKFFSASDSGLGTEALVSNTGEDKALASGSLFNGVITTVTGAAAFNAKTTFDLTAFGGAYFAAPTPFYNIAFYGFTNTADQTHANYNSAVGCFTPACLISVNHAVGVTDFLTVVTVPEPTALGILGLGLVGMAWTRRKLSLDN